MTKEKLELKSFQLKQNLRRKDQLAHMGSSDEVGKGNNLLRGNGENSARLDGMAGASGVIFR